MKTPQVTARGTPKCQSTQSLFIIVPLFIIVLTEKCTFLCIVYCVLCIVYCLLYIVYCVLFIVYCVLCIVLAQ